MPQVPIIPMHHLWHSIESSYPLGSALGKKWNRLMHEEKQVNIDEFIKLKDAYINRHPNYKYKPNDKKHQPFN